MQRRVAPASTKVQSHPLVCFSQGLQLSILPGRAMALNAPRFHDRWLNLCPSGVRMISHNQKKKKKKKGGGGLVSASLPFGET